MIDIYSFTWEAFAALATGLSAVFAAVIVGLRQVDIAKAQTEIAGRQAEILGKQVGLEELKLRNELFDRRFAIYDKAQAYLVTLITIGNQNTDKSLTEFLTATDTARFLFDQRGYGALLDIYELSKEVNAAREEVETARAGSRDVTPHMEALKTLKARAQIIYNSLHDSFPELWLAEIRNHPE